MGAPQRFDLMAKLAEKYLPKNIAIADVASGKGYLQSALRQLGYKNITSWDKRKRNAKNRKGFRYGYFDWCWEKERYDAVVAMHPDEGTDHAILYAVKHQIPAIICPCCVKPSASMYWGVRKYEPWIKHLISLADGHLEVQKNVLRMNGRNLVLIFKPKDK